MKTIAKNLSHARGFSLIELLITMAITGIIMSAVYGVYIASLHTANTEEQRVDIQQGQRFAIDLLMSQLRHAGYDKWESLEPTIVAAGSDYIYFTADFQGCDTDVGPSLCTQSAPGAIPPGPFPDGDVDDAGEHIVFCIYNNNLGFMIDDGALDTDGDGIPDIGDIDQDGDGLVDAGHNHGGGNHQPVTAIERIEFYYTLSTGAPTTFPANPADIRSVLVSLLARTETEDTKFRHSAADIYMPPRDGGPPVWTGYADGRRRRLMAANVSFRNMGL